MIGRPRMMDPSTRLRASSGQSTVYGLSSFDPKHVEATAAALDLCLACQGCKAECPSGVDMAKLKFAFQSEYYKTHRRQWRDYVFGYFHLTAKLAASIAPMTNALTEVTTIKNLIAKGLGITPHRPFPKFSSQRARLKPRSTPRTRRVIFLSDSFARYIEPETEQAALNILSACGLDVHVLPILGAGASFLSKAFIDQARAHAARVLDLLNQVDPASELPIVGIEPPEVYTFKEDYMDLLPHQDKKIRQRLDKVWLLDEFLIRSTEFNELRVANIGLQPTFDNNLSTKKVYFHPHCHQRAQGPSPDGLPNGTQATIELLRSCGYDVELMDTGCCGMAGTFGYEAEHYELSMKIGELKLFPKIREWKIETTDSINRKSAIVNRNSQIVSSGAACRMQVRQGTGVDAIHPIMLVAKLVAKWKSYEDK
jgi:Fe-S oxidoreductase